MEIEGDVGTAVAAILEGLHVDGRGDWRSVTDGQSTTPTNVEGRIEKERFCLSRAATEATEATPEHHMTALVVFAREA
eukprot:scaffold2926_cov247-Pinguiococcus_pyrenoidosus.AAC.1